MLTPSLQLPAHYGHLAHPIKIHSLTWSTLVKAGHVGVETGRVGAHAMGVGDPLWEEEKLQVARRITLTMPAIHYILVAITMVTGSSETHGKSLGAHYT